MASVLRAASLQLLKLEPRALLRQLVATQVDDSGDQLFS